MKRSHGIGLVVLSALLFAAGFAVGRAQSDDPAMVRADEAEERLIALLRIPETQVRTRALASYFAGLNATNLETVEEVYEYHRKDVDVVASVLFASWWAQFDPGSAFAGRIPPNWGGDDAWTRAVVREWVRKDPATALAAVRAIPAHPEATKLEAMRALINGWFDHADTNPGDLLNLFDQVSQVRARGELFILWAGRMLETRGADYAIEFVESMPEGRHELRSKRELMGRLAAQLVPVDIDRAVSFAERNADKPAGTKVGYYLVGRWGHEDGPAAMAWATSGKAPNAFRVVERAWRSFSIADREAARSWMASQPYSKAIEPAYASYLVGMARDDYRRALELASKIEDERYRQQVWQAVGRSWLADDPAGAEAWMAQAPISPETERMIRAIQPPSEIGRVDFDE
jgi:hypothetical protein